jgi:hypothetical protein
MSQLIRLIYASRSTLPPEGKTQGLDLGVARILAKSRKNNRQRQIVGGLLFGDGCFLQCLEGAEEAVSTLYKKIESDPRHRDVRELSRASINERTFGDWSMKYVRGERSLSDLMRGWGMVRFDPYVLKPKQIEAAVTYLREQSDAAQLLPDEQQASSKREAPQSYIGKNVPLPWSGDSAVKKESLRVRGKSSFLRWAVIGAAVVVLGAVLYFVTR